MNAKNAFTCLLMAIVTALLVTGCATGSAIPVGDALYARTDAETIQILTRFPADYETVGLVEASAPKGYLCDANEAAKDALGELRKQAASLGATAIVLKDYGSTTVPDFSFGGDDDLGVIFSSERKTVTGEAIRIP